MRISFNDANDFKYTGEMNNSISQYAEERKLNSWEKSLLIDLLADRTCVVAMTDTVLNFEKKRTTAENR